MRRREFIKVIAGSAAWPLVAQGQPAERMRRIGVLMNTAADDAEGQARLAAFQQALNQLGWTDGGNMRIDVRWSAGDAKDIRKYAAELIALAPDVILAPGASTVGPVLQGTRTVPIVFTSVPDPVGAGFVDSLSRPGGNATGFVAFEYGMGVKWVRHIDRTYDVGRMRAALKEALTTPETGPKVIVASSECMLNRQRREKPLVEAAIGAGKRVVKPRFGIDEDICTGDHACMRLSGCPSLTVKPLDDPLRDDPVASIDQSCVGCGNCGEVADAAVLCPSFYRADLIQNPTKLDVAALNSKNARSA